MGYSKPVAFEQLPQPAQQAVRNEVGSRRINRIDQDIKNGQVAYRVEVQKGAGWTSWSNPTLWVTPSGSILKESTSLSSRNQQVTEPAGAQTPSPRTDPDYQ
jgi:hypothetical protein